MPKPRQQWLEPGTGTHIALEIQPQLQILEYALLEDATGPVCSMVDRDKYLAEGALRLRESIVLALQGAGIILPEEPTGKAMPALRSVTECARLQFRRWTNLPY